MAALPQGCGDHGGLVRADGYCGLGRDRSAEGLRRLAEGRAPRGTTSRAAATPEAVDGQQAVALPKTERGAGANASSLRPVVDDGPVTPRSPELKGATPTGSGVESDGGIQVTGRAAITAVEVQREPKAPGRALDRCAQGADAKAPPIEPGTHESTLVRKRHRRRCHASCGRTARAGPAIEMPVSGSLSDIRLTSLSLSLRSRTTSLRASAPAMDGRPCRSIATSNVAAGRCAQYRTALIEERYRQAQFDYAPQRDTWVRAVGRCWRRHLLRAGDVCVRPTLVAWMTSRLPLIGARAVRADHRGDASELPAQQRTRRPLRRNQGAELGGVQLSRVAHLAQRMPASLASVFDAFLPDGSPSHGEL